MSLLMFEGWDWLPNNTSTALIPTGTYYPGKWTHGATGRYTGWNGLGYSVGSNVTANGPIYRFPATKTSIIFGARMLYSGAPQASFGPMVTFYDSTFTAQLTLAMNDSGQLTLRLGDYTGTEIATGTTVLIQNSWYFVEIKFTVNNTTGSYEVKIGGVSEFSGTSTDTQATANTDVEYLRMRGKGSGVGQWDTCYLCDTAGTKNNDFLGVIDIDTFFPTGDSSVAWTPLSGSNYQNVDETTGSDSDTTYNYSGTTGQIDRFSHGGLSYTPTTIFGVSVGMVARKEDTGAQTARPKLESNTTVVNGSAFDPGTSYVYWADVWEDDPDTAGDWSDTKVNATTFGYEYV